MLGTLGTSLFSAIVTPFLLRSLSRQDADRALLREEFHTRLNHLDSCFDALKAQVLGDTCTREDFAALQVNLNSTMDRMRTAISGDTNGLHARIMRLEDKFFNARQG